MEEIWKEITGFEGIYVVSNFGNIKRMLPSNGAQVGKILKHRSHPGGYSIVSLCINSKANNFYVHRLVAMAFIENKNSRLEVNHINGIKTDNRVENLEWCTRLYNVTDYIKNGRAKYSSKKVFQYDLNGNFIREYDSTIQAANELKCTSSLIQMAANPKNITPKAKGFIWRYTKTL